MSSLIKCKTCKKTFSGCSTCEKFGIFYWKDICCSIECYQAYVEKVLEARKGDSNE